MAESTKDTERRALRAEAANEAVFDRFRKNPVVVSDAPAPEGMRRIHAEFLTRVLRRHRALSLPR